MDVHFEHFAPCDLCLMVSHNRLKYISAPYGGTLYGIRAVRLTCLCTLLVAGISVCMH